MVSGIFFAEFLIFTLIGYAFGNVLFGLILSKIKKQDLRTTGSGNVGATNALRAFGATAAFLVYVVDMFKGWLAVFISIIIYKYWTPQFITNNLDYSKYGFIVYFAGLGTILGHCFPILYVIKLFITKFNFQECKKYSGGKGAAATSGFFLAISPWVFLIAFSIFMIVFFICRYVSVSSIIGIIGGTLLFLIPQLDFLYMLDLIDANILNVPPIGNFNELYFVTYLNNWEYIITIFSISALISIIVVWKHKPNLIKLRNGEEKKLFSSKK